MTIKRSIKTKSFVNGAKRIVSPPYALGFAITITSATNVVKSTLNIDLEGFVGAIISSYQDNFVVPTVDMFRFIGLSIPELGVSLVIIWIILGTAIARTRARYSTELERELADSPLIFGSRDRHNQPETSRQSYLWLMQKINWSDYVLELPILKRIWIQLRYRITQCYNHSPAMAKAALDVIFLPVSAFTFFQRPILVYLDNEQNPEENWFQFASTREILRYDESPFWIKLKPQQDFRYFFMAQVLMLVVVTTILIVMNSDLAS